MIADTTDFLSGMIAALACALTGGLIVFAWLAYHASDPQDPAPLLPPPPPAPTWPPPGLEDIDFEVDDAGRA